MIAINYHYFLINLFMPAFNQLKLIIDNGTANNSKFLSPQISIKNFNFDIIGTET
jgi:hypothetical protein